MPRASYRLECELAYNTWSDLSADWDIGTPLVIERGIEPGQRVAGVGRMSLALYNPDGRYTPGHPNATPGFAVGIGVRLRVSDGANTYTLFYGRLAAIQPRREAGKLGVVLVCLDEMAALERTRLEAFPLMLAVRPREVINALVDTCFTPPGLLKYWRLGHPEAGKLGVDTTLPGTYTGKRFDVGQSVFPWAGDTWRNAPSAIQALCDVCISEGGYFALAADGTPTFWDRHARPRHVTADAELEGSLAGLWIDCEQQWLANRVAITTHPRVVSDTVEVLWTSEADIRLEYGTPRVLVCHYRDPQQQGALLGAQGVLAPQEGIDYAAERRIRYKGVTYTFDVTEYLSINAELGAASARLTLASRWAASPIYVTRLQVRGVPLRVYEPVTTIVSDERSEVAYGPLALRLDMPLQDNAAVAGDMASALLANRRDPHPWITVVVEATASATHLAQGLARDVGNRLHITDAALALDGAACFIESIRHEIERGGARHRVIWRTGPADLDAYWILGQAGYGQVGESTRLGY